MAECRYFPKCRTLEAADRTRIQMDCTSRSTGCRDYHPMPDVDALLSLADEVKRDTCRVDRPNLGIYASCYLSWVAGSIYDALGVGDV